MQRVIVTGTPGAGKTWLARAIARQLGMTHYELDALHQGPGWTKLDSFEDNVMAFAGTGRWVTEDQYHRFLGDVLWQRADTVIWLDLPRRIVMRRLLRRSLIRALSRAELWNGNREDWRRWLDIDHPLRWTWENFERRRRETSARIERHPAIHVVRLASPGQVSRWLEATLAATATCPLSTEEK